MMGTHNKSFLESCPYWHPGISKMAVREKRGVKFFGDVLAGTAYAAEMRKAMAPATQQYYFSSIIGEKMEGGVKHFLIDWGPQNKNAQSFEPEESLRCKFCSLYLFLLPLFALIFLASRGLFALIFLASLGQQKWPRRQSKTGCATSSATETLPALLEMKELGNTLLCRVGT